MSSRDKIPMVRSCSPESINRNDQRREREGLPPRPAPRDMTPTLQAAKGPAPGGGPPVVPAKRLERLKTNIRAPITSRTAPIGVKRATMVRRDV
jgi:hypothetical protein